MSSPNKLYNCPPPSTDFLLIKPLSHQREEQWDVVSRHQQDWTCGSEITYSKQLHNRTDRQKKKSVDLHLILEGKCIWFYPVLLWCKTVYDSCSFCHFKTLFFSKNCLFPTVHAKSVAILNPFCKPLTISRLAQLKILNTWNRFLFDSVSWNWTTSYVSMNSRILFWKMKRGQLSVTKTAQSSLQHQSYERTDQQKTEMKGASYCRFHFIIFCRTTFLKKKKTF